MTTIRPFAGVAPLSMLCLSLVACATSTTAHKPETKHVTAQGPNLRTVIWRDPGRTASLNLIYGAGGKAHAPDPKGVFTFLTEDTSATSPKFEVADRHGIQWKVKLGQEPQSETAAARLLWAAGYFVDEDYYLPELTVIGMPKLERGSEFVSAGGRVRGARLERKLRDVKKLGTWDWFDNPFTDTRELNGLRVMMALLNNWDLKEVNNSIYETGGEHRYVITDLGATFGNTGNRFTRSKSEPQEYADSRFVDRTTVDLIDFVLHSRPLFVEAVNLNNFRERSRMEEVAEKIPRADARWLGRRLSLLSDAQIRDSFRAAGYAPDAIEVCAQTVRKRIDELNAM